MPPAAPSKLARTLLPLVLLALAVGAVLALWLTRAETDARPPQEQVWPVRTVTVSPGPKQPVVMLYGRVESARAASIRTAVQADVLTVAIREGERVSEGQVLLRLDEADLLLVQRQRQAQVAELEAQLALQRREREADRNALQTERELLTLADRELTRIRRLAQGGSASDSQVDAAERELRQRRLAVNQRELAVDSYEQRISQLRARIEQAEAALAQARRDVARTVVRAPFDGRVAAVDVAAGTRVSPGTPLVRLYDTAALQVRAPLPSVQLGRVREALRAGETLEATGIADGLCMPLRLHRLAGEAQQGQAGGDVIFDVMEDQPQAPLGQFVSVELRLPPEPRAVAVPYEAIYGNNRLYRVADGRMQSVDIRRIGDTVLPDGRRAALVRGDALERGMRIVATQIPRATNGLRIRELGTQ
ncbi:biotin/lipoyl-binding protein [Ectothiorhodospiraceae bacterium WFHF3C12]|nr:biotin/lipoyl-binding protein [Ectothiorhodospiraceae bacterium WFHF3C12]